MRVTMLLRNLFVRDARVLREARELARAGHEVTVVALHAGDLPVEEVRDGVRIRRAVTAGRLAGPTILGAAGNAPTADPATPSKARRRPPAAVWLRDVMLERGMTRAALATPADVYHAHDLTTLTPALRAARSNGARVVYDAHELYTELSGLGAGERKRWARVERGLIGRADAVIVPSPSRGEALVDRYGIAPPAVVMNCPPRGPLPDPAAGPLARVRRDGELLLVYAGGFIAGRGLENLVAATRMLRKTRLVMLGWGPLEAELRAVVARSDMTERVTFLGAVDPDDVIAVAAGGDVGLAPYLPVGLNNVLAAPNKLYEYLHAGLAVAASDLPDIRRIVEDNDVGELFEAADPSSIAAAVRRATAFPDRLRRLRENAAAAAGLFTWEAQAQVLLEVYERLAVPAR
ncbi:MAG: glycosyltransferase family 4 protein [Actinomycetota bacterium]